jgi:uncharacterized protein YebE (UPF0316 family)
MVTGRPLPDRPDPAPTTDDHLMTDLPLLTSVADVWALLWPALAVAVLRIGDVTLNVFRTVFTVNGRKGLAALFHGLEGGVWLAAAGIVFADMTAMRAAGFVVGVASGTFIGTSIIERLRLGMTTVRIYADSSEDATAGLRIAAAIHAAVHGATTFDGHGFKGPVQMVLSTVRRRDAATVLELARGVDADAFAAVDNDLQPVAVGGRV